MLDYILPLCQPFQPAGGEAELCSVLATARTAKQPFTPRDAEIQGMYDRGVLLQICHLALYLYLLAQLRNMKVGKDCLFQIKHFSFS